MRERFSSVAIINRTKTFGHSRKLALQKATCTTLVPLNFQSIKFFFAKTYAAVPRIKCFFNYPYSLISSTSSLLISNDTHCKTSLLCTRPILQWVPSVPSAFFVHLSTTLLRHRGDIIRFLIMNTVGFRSQCSLLTFSYK